MPRHCTVCNHPQRDSIEELLLKGDSIRVIAGQFSLSYSSLQRHMSEHISEIMIQAKEAKEVTQADTLLDQVKHLQNKALNILSKAEAAKDYRAATGAIKEARGCLELLAKLLGELNEGQTVNVLIAPEWLSLRNVILEALEPYPQARISVATARRA
jgi:hypothetical protein